MTLREQIAAVVGEAILMNDVAELPDALLPIVEAALQAEREACAKLMLSLPANRDPWHESYRAACAHGAAAIRARAEEGK